MVTGIDGLWASKLGDVSIVTNVDAYKLSSTVFRAASSDLSFADYARQALGRLVDEQAHAGDGIDHRPRHRLPNGPRWD